ncbi:MAG TPA: quinoprotein dehydrogenase-associated putative ABC transporter substrate-binding protein [Polyangia bacterium]|nr:quinoprotein dehydrogenase-associated putative ABC transporter substrate-binding protein [Polyangia bacterium]
MRRPLARTAAFALAWAAPVAAAPGPTVAAAPAGVPRVLRVCADPNNMPFSDDRDEGIDNRLAHLVADALGARLQYTWRPQRRGFVRETLGAGRCDVMMEAPAGYGRAATTTPYYRSSYVFLTRRDHPVVRSLDDPRLRGLRVGVQVIGDDYANAPPAAALGRRGLAANVVGFPVYGDYGKPDPLGPIGDAVAAGTVDVAVVWGPLAGWYAKEKQPALRVTPVSPSADGRDLPLSFDIAMAVRHGDTALLRRLEAVIRDHRPAIRGILEDFGVPLSPGLEPGSMNARHRRPRAPADD